MNKIPEPNGSAPQLPAKRRTWVPSAYERLVGLQFLIALSLVVFIVVHYGYHAQAIWLDAIYVAELLIAQTAAIYLIARALKGRTAKLVQMLTTALITLLTGSLLLVYAANIGSNEAWGGYINATLVEHASAHLRALAALLGVPVAAPYVALMLFFVVIYAVMYKTGRAIGSQFAAAVNHPPSANSARGRRRPRLLVVLAVIFSCFVPGYSTILIARGEPPEYHGEPLSSLFLAARSALPQTTYLKRLAAEDRQLRADYRRHLPAHFDRRNVVLITIDSLRAKSLPMYGYPHDTAPFLNELVHEGRVHVVPRTIATCPESVCGISSTLSSRDDSRITVGLYKLNDVLHDAGYDVDFILSGSHSWNGLRAIYGKHIDYYVDGLGFDRYSANDDRGILEYLRRRPRYTGRPTFFFFHLMSVHLLGRWTSFHAQKHTRPLPVSDVPYWKSKAYYDKSIGHADRIVRQIFALLKEKGYLQHCLVVILADHGEAFGEHGEYGHISSLYTEELRIPLLIYDTDPAKYRDPPFATQLDVAPTIVDRLGLPIPRSWQGRSLLRPPPSTRMTFQQLPRKPPTYAVHYLKDHRTYVLITRKLLPTAFDGKDELYELTHDPQERRNLMPNAPPRLLATLLRGLTRYQQAQALPELLASHQSGTSPVGLSTRQGRARTGG